MERTGLPASGVLASLTMLTMRGILAQQPGNFFEARIPLRRLPTPAGYPAARAYPNIGKPDLDAVVCR